MAFVQQNGFLPTSPAAGRDVGSSCFMSLPTACILIPVRPRGSWQADVGGTGNPSSGEVALLRQHAPSSPPLTFGTALSPDWAHGRLERCDSGGTPDRRTRRVVPRGVPGILLWNDVINTAKYRKLRHGQAGRLLRSERAPSVHPALPQTSAVRLPVPEHWI